MMRWSLRRPAAWAAKGHWPAYLAGAVLLSIAAAPIASGMAAGATSSAPKPGTYGEPLSFSGIFKGCGPFQDTRMCMFLAEGWRYVVIRDDRTPRRVFDRLTDAKLNDRVVVEGDLVSEGDVSAEITVRSVQLVAEPDQPFARLRNGLVGAWESLDDPNSTLRFEDDGRQFGYYQGELAEEGAFEVTTQCPNAAGSGNGPFLVTRIGDEAETFCYGFAKLTEEELSLVYLPRGNTLRYQRYE